MSGSFLPMQLIYKGTTNRCLPKDVGFPADFHVICTTNHWCNESKTIQRLEKIVFLYVGKNKKNLNLPDQKAMLIFDVFKGHVTEKITSIIKKNNCVIIYVPNNLTDKFQPLDRSSNQRCYVRKGVLRNFANSQENTGVKVSFLIKSFIKKETLAQVFSCDFCEISRKTFFTEHLWTTASNLTSTWMVKQNNF